MTTKQEKYTKNDVKNFSTARWIDWTIDFGAWRFGYQDQVIGRAECPYLHRRNIYLGLWSLRYHIFHNSDEDRALHNHPWAFWTFPIVPYDEIYSDENGTERRRKVKPWRLHLRRHGFKHRVIKNDDKPARTFIFTCRKKSSWGFFGPNGFVNWRVWGDTMGLPPCADYEKPK